MLKKIISIWLAFILMFTIASCGSTNVTSSNGEASESAVSSDANTISESSTTDSEPAIENHSSNAISGSATEDEETETVNLISHISNDGGSENSNYSWEYTYTYDSKGAIATKNYTISFLTGAKQVTSTDYDEDGKIVSEVINNTSSDGETTIQSYSYEYSNQIGSYEGDLSSGTIEYNTAGKIVSKMISNYYEGEGRQDLTYSYIYDESSNLTSLTVSADFYDEHEILVSNSESPSALGGWYYCYEYSYDEAGNISKCTYVNTLQNAEYYYEYSYNSDGELTEATSYSKNESELLEIMDFASFEYAYLSGGLLETVDVYDEDGDWADAADFEYSNAVVVSAQRAQEIKKEQQKIINNCFIMYCE